MTFARLLRADWVAFAAALALLLVLSVDWYSTALGDEARRIEELADPQGAAGGEVEREVDEDARIIAEGEERNAFQEDGFLDRLILVLLLASAAGAIATAFVRAAGRRTTPAGATSIVAATATLLIAYRIVQEPGLDAATTVKIGALLGLLTAGVLALATRAAHRAEREGPPAESPGPPSPATS